MGKMKRWTEAEKEFLIREYKNLSRQRMAKMLGRTLNSVDKQYYNLTHGIKKIKTNRIVTECPRCNSKMFNPVTAETFYCMNCLHEFTKSGKIIEPLWEGGEAR